jgi:hypothetical protein
LAISCIASAAAEIDEIATGERATRLLQEIERAAKFSRAVDRLAPNRKRPRHSEA